MGYSAIYLEKNREKINQKRREKYNSDARKVDYERNKERISELGKADRCICPHCKLSFRTVYLQKHIKCRHPEITE